MYSLFSVYYLFSVCDNMAGCDVCILKKHYVSSTHNLILYFLNNDNKGNLNLVTVTAKIAQAHCCYLTHNARKIFAKQMTLHLTNQEYWPCYHRKLSFSQN